MKIAFFTEGGYVGKVPKNTGGLGYAGNINSFFNDLREIKEVDSIDEVNEYIDTDTIPNNVDYAKNLAGQLKENEKSAQLEFDLIKVLVYNSKVF